MSKFNYIKIYIFSFLFTLIGVFVAYAINGIYPFGEYSVLTADLQSQYINVTATFFEQLKNNENIFVTWHSGLGSNLYAIALYIMANPLSVLFAFVDVEYYQEIYFLILMLKISFVGFCFSAYVANSELLKLTDIKFNVAFSTCYALSVFTLKATINPMWIENIALLPIIFLGVEKIIEYKKPILFFVSIIWCFITNYYLSYMTGIFALIYFGYYIILVKDVKQGVLSAFLMFMVFTVLAIGVSMIVIYPSYCAISDTYTDVVGVGYESQFIKFSLKDIIFAFVHNISERSASGYPCGYFGILPLWLMLGYFINSRISGKQKLVSATIMLFLILSLHINGLYFAWHLFRSPTGFDGRFLYGVILFALILAIQDFKCFDDGVNKKHFLIIGILLLLGANYSVLGRMNIYYIVGLAGIFALVAIYGALLISKRKKILVFVIVFEMFITAYNSFRIIKLWDGYGFRDEYITYVTEYKDSFQMLENYDDSFYRSDCDKIGTYNSPMAVGYNAINHFSSLANQKTFEVMRKMGVTTLTDNKVLVSFGQNIVLDSLFNIKYYGVMDKSDAVTDELGRTYYYNGLRITNPDYSLVSEIGKNVFYENKKVFPLMFGVSEKIKNVFLNGNTPFENQNIFINSMFEDLQVELYEKINVENAEVVNCQVNTKDGLLDIHLLNLPEDKIVADTADEIGIVKFEYEVQEAGNYFTVLNGEFAKTDIVNRQCGFELNGVSLPLLRMENELKDMGWYEKGDVITLCYYSLIDTKIYWPEFYRLDTCEFDTVSKILNENKLYDIKNVKGDINAKSDFDKESLVFTSIGYDEGFSVYIDGKETEKIRIADGFLGYYVPEGKHDIRISYVSPGYTEGKNISVVFLGISAVVLFLNMRYNKKEEVILSKEEGNDEKENE